METSSVMCLLSWILRTALGGRLRKLFMRQSIRLFIGGREVDLGKSTDILYNYNIDDVLSPGAVRNAFSRTLSLPSTPRNHRAFGHIFEGDEVNGYDASKKVDFVLYNGSEVYETGYCRLTAVKRTYNSTTYDVSLFGSLGSLFWNLSYNPDSEAGDGEKKTLADLDFGNGQEELDFDITKEAVKDAWEHIGDPDSKWNIINFAPTYNGIPEDFDADKVLVYTGQQSSSPVTRGNRNELTTHKEVDGVDYYPYQGYVLAELPKEYTGDEMREWRSYLTRPVVNVKRVIEACADSRNNSGYNVVLHPSFFNDNNPYWSQAWMTLPLLTSIDYTAKEEVPLTVALGSPMSGTTTTGDTGYYEDRVVTVSGETGNMQAMKVVVDVSVDALFSTAPGETVYPSALNQSYGINYMCSVFLQLVAFDQFGNAIGGSDLYNLTSMYGTRRVSQTVGRTTRSQIINYIPVPSDFDFDFWGDGYVQMPGGFTPVNGNYRWVGGAMGENLDHITLVADRIPQDAYLKLCLTKVYRAPQSATWNRWDTLWKAVPVEGRMPYYTPVYCNGFNVTLNSYQVYVDSEDAIRSGARITKKTLLSTSYTPAEFLLSYCKLFGLYFVQDPYEKKVTIMPRSEFFERDEDPVDIQDQIDRSREATLTPLSFDSKWYLWSLDGEGEYYENYGSVYAKEFGAKRVNTGFGFNNETKRVMDGNIFRNAVQCVERSSSFCLSNNSFILPWRFQGFTYNLYHDREDTTEVEYQPVSSIDLYTKLGGRMYYDIWDKVQLHAGENRPNEGDRVLLFYDGMKSLMSGGKDPGYIISDDNSTMNILNDGTPTWLSSMVDYDQGGNPVCIHVTEAPHFSRYLQNEVGNILLSWDFGVPDVFYVLNSYQSPGTDVYSQYWKSYIGDLYDRNTRILKTRMRIKGKPDVNWLRRFYWFDNSLWRLTEIKDWNVAEEGVTEVTFVRVNDKANYTNEATTTGQTITLTASKSLIEAGGETISIAVHVNDGGSWTIDGYGITFSQTGGTGDAVITATFPPNTYAGMTRNYEILATGDAGATFVLNIEQDVAGFSWTRVGGSGDVPNTGGQVLMLLSSETAWNVTTQRGTVSPASGTTTSGTQIVVDVPANDSSYVQEFRITATNENGAQIWYTIHQQAQYWASLSPYTQTVGTSGGTVSFAFSTNVPDVSRLRLYFDNNWGNAEIVGSQLVVTAYENPASYGYQRNMWVDVYLLDEYGQVSSSKLASCCVYILKPE